MSYKSCALEVFLLSYAREILHCLGDVSVELSPHSEVDSSVKNISRTGMNTSKSCSPHFPLKISIKFFSTRVLKIWASFSFGTALSLNGFIFIKDRWSKHSPKRLLLSSQDDKQLCRLKSFNRSLALQLASRLKGSYVNIIIRFHHSFGLILFIIILFVNKSLCENIIYKMNDS